MSLKTYIFTIQYVWIKYLLVCFFGWWADILTFHSECNLWCKISKHLCMSGSNMILFVSFGFENLATKVTGIFVIHMLCLYVSWNINLLVTVISAKIAVKPTASFTKIQTFRHAWKRERNKSLKWRWNLSLSISNINMSLIVNHIGHSNQDYATSSKRGRLERFTT